MSDDETVARLRHDARRAIGDLVPALRWLSRRARTFADTVDWLLPEDQAQSGTGSDDASERAMVDGS